MRERALAILSVFLAAGAVFGGVLGLAVLSGPQPEDPYLACAREVRAAQVEARRETGAYLDRVATACGVVEVRRVGPAYYEARVGSYRVFPDGVARVRP